MAEHVVEHLVEGWILSGGQGSRVGGQDKGLLSWQGHPMAWQVAQRLASQVTRLTINANRHASTYAQWPWPVRPDDADLPALSGPLIGILTGLRHCQSPWLQVAPCDGPTLPLDLVACLHHAAQEARADVAVPFTPACGEEPERHHWTCALIRANAALALERAIRQGERRVGHWIAQGRWISVSFERADAFININTPETWHAQR